MSRLDIIVTIGCTDAREPLHARARCPNLPMPTRACVSGLTASGDLTPNAQKEGPNDWKSDHPKEELGRVCILVEECQPADNPVEGRGC